MIEIYWKNKYSKRKLEVLKVKKLMVFGICVVMVSVIALSACTEITQSGEAANTSNTEEVNNTPKKTESPKVATEETTKPLIPATPGKVSGVPVEQSPDVFDGAIKRDSILEGTIIPFTVETKRCLEHKMSDMQVFIIRSSEELIVANKSAFKEATVDYANVDKYNDDYFKENALIFLIMMFGSGSYRMRVDSIIKNQNEFSFNITVLIPEDGPMTTDMLMAGNYIEVKKSEITDVNNVSYFRTGGTYKWEYWSEF